MKFLFLPVLAVTACALHAQTTPVTLKDAFAKQFLVGAALETKIIVDTNHPARPLVAEQFSSITPANALKWGPFNPQPGVYEFGPVDAYVAYGEAHGMFIVGHTLFWHHQTPAWVFQDDAGNPITREALLKRMRERVRLLAQRYGSKIQLWDVVNETYEDDGSLRDSSWTRVIGPDFVAEAFRIANEELPANVRLNYNDYSMYMPGRRDAVVRMIKDLKSRGIRIDGVGMQGHWSLREPNLADAEASIVAFAAAGVRVDITELDVEVLPRTMDAFGADLNKRGKRTPENDPYSAGLPAEMQDKLAKRYADIFTLFAKHADKIDRVTFWGVTDADSWLNSWPVIGRTNHPLLWDRHNKPKPAFDAVIGVASGKK